MGEVIRKTKGDKFVGWYVRYRDADGKRKQRASHQPTHALARRYLLEVEGRVARGLLGIPEPAPPPPSVDELIERFLREYSRAKIKDLEKYRVYARTALRRALPLLGTLRADLVQPLDIDRLRQSLGKTCAPSSVRVTLDFLHTVYSWAQKAGIVDKNPLSRIEKPASTASLDFLHKDEVQALLNECERRTEAGGLADHMRYACILTALHTGLRRGELFGLRWLDIDLHARRITVARSYGGTPKSGKARHLRLPDSVAPVLAAWLRVCPRTSAGLVFPVVSGTPRMGGDFDMLGLPELLAAAGCRPHVRPWHALRHTFASHFIMSGGNILSLQKILGHSDIKMTLIYAHLAPDFLGEEMNRIRYR